MKLIEILLDLYEDSQASEPDRDFKVGDDVKCFSTQRAGKNYNKFGTPARSGDTGVVTKVNELSDITIVQFKTKEGKVVFCHVQNLIKQPIESAFSESTASPAELRLRKDQEYSLVLAGTMKREVWMKKWKVGKYATPKSNAFIDRMTKQADPKYITKADITKMSNKDLTDLIDAQANSTAERQLQKLASQELDSRKK